MPDFKDSLFQQDSTPKRKKPSDVESLENRLAALEEERRRRLNADVTSLRSGRKVDPSKEEMEDVNTRISTARKELAKARANLRRDLAKP